MLSSCIPGRGSVECPLILCDNKTRTLMLGLETWVHELIINSENR
jgi:hypothetical protein